MLWVCLALVRLKCCTRTMEMGREVFIITSFACFLLSFTITIWPLCLGGILLIRGQYPTYPRVFPPATAHCCFPSTTAQAGLGAQAGSVRAFLAIPGVTGLCPDGSGDEVDGGDGNTVETSRAPTPRCSCAFVNLPALLKAVRVRKQPFPIEIYYLFLGPKILPMPHILWQP